MKEGRQHLESLLEEPGKARQEHHVQCDETTCTRTHTRTCARTYAQTRTHTQTSVPVQWGRRWLLFLISGPVVHHLPQCVHLYQKPLKTQSHFEASALRRTGCLQQHLGIGPLVSSWGGRQPLPSGPGRMWDLLCRVCLWKGSHTQHRSIRSPLTPTLTLA